MIRIFFLLFGGLTILSGCINRKQSNEQLIQKIDSLQSDIMALKQQLAQPNTTDTSTNSISNNNQNLTAETTSIQPKIIPSKLEANKSDTSHKKTIKPTPKENPLPKPNNSFNQGKVYYYQTSPRQKSVEVTAWQEDGKRKIYFLNPAGDTTYTIEDIRRSYSYITELVKFHPNGACSFSKTSINPGASMYWYETEITFDENNNPLWKREMQFPQESTAQNLNNKWWWNAKAKTWIKQEIIKEQEVPH